MTALLSIAVLLAFPLLCLVGFVIRYAIDAVLDRRVMRAISALPPPPAIDPCLIEWGRRVSPSHDERLRAGNIAINREISRGGK